jgi:hypothetical protein
MEDEEETIPVIVVTPEFKALTETMDFTQMTEDEFMDWMLAHATAHLPRSLFPGIDDIDDA